MDIHLPQYLLDDLFHQHEDERDRMRAGIPSSMTQAQSYLPISIKIVRHYKGMRKRQYGRNLNCLNSRAVYLVLTVNRESRHGELILTF